MKILLDTGVLLRIVHATDAQHPVVRSALDQLKVSGGTFFCGIQNVAEFWNVNTRPITARGGFGLTVAETRERLESIEGFLEVLPESRASYAEWRRLLVQHGVSGVQVHDARLAALIRVEQIDALLTLNARDFARFPWLNVLTPQGVAGQSLK